MRDDMELFEVESLPWQPDGAVQEKVLSRGSDGVTLTRLAWWPAVRTQPIGERRARDREVVSVRNQWPILAAAHCPPSAAAVAVADDTVHLGMLALDAGTGGVFFVIQ